MSLTKNEVIALECCLNYADRESQLSDNFSNGDVATIAAELGFTGQQTGGVISSLIQKGLAYAEVQDVNGKDYEFVELTEAGVHAIFDVLESE